MTFHENNKRYDPTFGAPRRCHPDDGISRAEAIAAMIAIGSVIIAIICLALLSWM